MSNLDPVSEAASQYILHVGDTEVWPVFWEHGATGEDGFFGGKASGPHMQSEIDRLSEEGEVPETEDTEVIRQFLFEKGIGLDCSAFAVHTLDSIYGAQGIDIGQWLSIPKRVVEEAARKPHWRAAYELIPRDLDQFDEVIPARWVADTFNRPLEIIVGARHIHDSSARPISMRELAPLDLIRFERDEGHLHTGVVAEVNQHQIRYWDAGGAIEGTLGGVRERFVDISDPFGDLEDQTWADGVQPRYTIEGRRLFLNDHLQSVHESETSRQSVQSASV